MRGLLIVILLMLCVSCTSTKYVEVPVETVRTEYINTIETKYDSVFLRDSVDRYIKGDTVFIEKYRYQYKYRDLVRVDTILRCDTIPTVVRVKETKEVEVNHLYWWQKLLMWIGGIFSVILIGFLTYKTKL